MTSDILLSAALKLKESPEEARRLILSIPHRGCAKAIDKHWQVTNQGKVRAQSVLWLFCWAKTGQRSEQARLVAVQVLDKLLPLSFAELDVRLDHEYARTARYATSNIEAELQARLA